MRLLQLAAVASMAIGCTNEASTLGRRADAVWSTIPSLHDRRLYPSCAKLSETTALCAGGEAGDTDVSTAEVFDLASKTWKLVAPMSDKRSGAPVAVLLDGRVLVAGGADHLSSAEIYDPKANTWTKTAQPMRAPHQYVRGVTLADGTVLVAGGSTGDASESDQAEIYDPKTDTWTSVGALTTPRGRFALVRLLDGRVLAWGGSAPNYPEVFDPATKTWRALAAMAVQLTDPGVVLLADGRVFALGGYDKSTDAGSKQAWFFDPKSDAVTPAPQDTVERLAESLTLLPSGRVLVAGGNDDGSTRLFDPVKGTYSDAGFLLDRRYAHGAIALGANVLIAGGTVDRGGTSGDTDKSELWSDPSETTTDAGAVTSPPPATSVGGSFTRCNKDAECSTGHCVDGVCCDTACADRCHSCALPSSPGVCTLEPIGVDLRGECGAALSCTGTCGPEGKCIGSLKGSLCAKSTCTSGSTGLGPSTCEAQGGTCPTDQATAFDCAPYACEPAFGACRTSCGTSADCAGGYLCEANSHTCIAPAPSNDDGGGCAIGRGSRASLLGVLIALSAIARLRRLTS